MSKLAAHIRDVIQKAGAITVGDYMQLALQHPEFGYYRHGDPLGKSGDFITAPEISQMFGEMLGLWCADVWRKMGEPQDFVLLEMGPGHGALMQDALRATAKIPGFHDALHLALLESSETLRALQSEKLSTHKPVHIAELSELPPLPAIAIANEFFDALPIRQFEKTFHGWCERLVSLGDNNLVFILSPPDEAVALLVPETMRDANPGTIVELSPAAINIMRDLARHIVRHQGAALIVDYGYLERDGKPTLQAVRRHAYADVLADPGEADITALVDFDMLRRAAVKQNAVVCGAIGQGEFLQALGIELRADQLKRCATHEQSVAIDAALHRLTDPSQMGILFKALAIASPNLAELPGF